MGLPPKHHLDRDGKEEAEASEKRQRPAAPQPQQQRQQHQHHSSSSQPPQAAPLQDAHGTRPSHPPMPDPLEVPFSEQPMALQSLAEMAAGRQFLPSTEFILACGTVTMDLERALVLVIRNLKFDIFQLPKGRKNIGEDLLQAALRETYEETGVRARELTINIPTRATVPRETSEIEAAAAAEEAEAESGGRGRNGCCRPNGSGSSNSSSSSSSSSNGKNPQVARYPQPQRSKPPAITCGRPNNEPLGLCHYPDPQSGVTKMVFYFAAVADSSLSSGSDRGGGGRVRGDEDTQEPWERLEAYWKPAAEAVRILHFKEDKMVVLRAIEVVHGAGYNMRQPK